MQPGALEDTLYRTVLNPHAEQATYDTKQKKKFYDDFTAGLPKGQGYKKVHIEDLVMAKDNDNAILAAVDVMRINKQHEDKFCITESCDIFSFDTLDQATKSQTWLLLKLCLWSG